MACKEKLSFNKNIRNEAKYETLMLLLLEPLKAQSSSRETLKHVLGKRNIDVALLTFLAVPHFLEHCDSSYCLPIVSSLIQLCRIERMHNLYSPTLECQVA